MTVHNLESLNLVITGFNQSSQQALGTIKLKLTVGDLNTKGVFHVIDALTSYNVLLGRSWLHENGIIHSTLHQCFKYLCKGIQKKVIADENPFTKAESYFADAKFYIGCETMNKIEHDPQTKSSKKDDSKRRPTFQYIPKSQRKSGASLLCPVQETKEVLKEVIIPLTKIDTCIPEEENPTLLIGNGKYPLMKFVHGEVSKLPEESNEISTTGMVDISHYHPNSIKIMQKNGL